MFFFIPSVKLKLLVEKFGHWYFVFLSQWIREHMFIKLWVPVYIIYSPSFTWSHKRILQFFFQNKYPSLFCAKLHVCLENLCFNTQKKCIEFSICSFLLKLHWYYGHSRSSFRNYYTLIKLCLITSAIVVLIYYLWIMNI